MIVSPLSSLLVIGCYWNDIQGQSSYSHQRPQRMQAPGDASPARSLLRASAPSLPSACLLLPAEPSADSWAASLRPGKRPTLGLFQLTVLEPEPATQPHKSWQIAGWAGNSGQGAAAHTCLSSSQAPGAAFQGLLQSQLSKGSSGGR